MSVINFDYCRLLNLDKNYAVVKTDGKENVYYV